MRGAQSQLPRLCTAVRDSQAYLEVVFSVSRLFVQYLPEVIPCPRHHLMLLQTDPRIRKPGLQAQPGLPSAFINSFLENTAAPLGARSVAALCCCSRCELLGKSYGPQTLCLAFVWPLSHINKWWIGHDLPSRTFFGWVVTKWRKHLSLFNLSLGSQFLEWQMTCRCHLAATVSF